MERKSFYFKQPVAYGEMNAAFDGVENALDNLVVDYGLTGVISGLEILQHGSGDLTVNYAAGTAYDANGKRIFVPVLENLNCAVDYLSTSTAVTTSGHSKILTIFAIFERSLSDPRTDGNGNTVFFEQAESYTLQVVQGTEAASPTPVAPIAGQILLADITLTFGETQILTGSISFARTQFYGNPAPVTVPAVTGTRFSLSAGVLDTQLAVIQAAIDTIMTSGADTILQFASVAALRAVSAPTIAAAVATIPTFGLYVWTPSSSVTDDGLFCIKPTSTSGNGRWLSMTAQLGANSGLTQNDSTGRVAAAKVRNGIIATVSYAQTTALALSLSQPMASFACLTNDVIIAGWSATGLSGNNLEFSGDGTVLTFPGQGSSLAGQILAANGGGAAIGVTTAAANGTGTINGASVGSSTLSLVTFFAIQIRP